MLTSVPVFCWQMVQLLLRSRFPEIHLMTTCRDTAYTTRTRTTTTTTIYKAHRALPLAGLRHQGGLYTGWHARGQHTMFFFFRLVPVDIILFHPFAEESERYGCILCFSVILPHHHSCKYHSGDANATEPKQIHHPRQRTVLRGYRMHLMTAPANLPSETRKNKTGKREETLYSTGIPS